MSVKHNICLILLTVLAPVLLGDCNGNDESRYEKIKEGLHNLNDEAEVLLGNKQTIELSETEQIIDGHKADLDTTSRRAKVELPEPSDSVMSPTSDAESHIGDNTSPYGSVGSNFVHNDSEKEKPASKTTTTYDEDYVSSPHTSSSSFVDFGDGIDENDVASFVELAGMMIDNVRASTESHSNRCHRYYLVFTYPSRSVSQAVVDTIFALNIDGLVGGQSQSHTHQTSTGASFESQQSHSFQLGSPMRLDLFGKLHRIASTLASKSGDVDLARIGAEIEACIDESHSHSSSASSVKFESTSSSHDGSGKQSRKRKSSSTSSYSHSSSSSSASASSTTQTGPNKRRTTSLAPPTRIVSMKMPELPKLPEMPKMPQFAPNLAANGHQEWMFE